MPFPYTFGALELDLDGDSLVVTGGALPVLLSDRRGREPFTPDDGEDIVGFRVTDDGIAVIMRVVDRRGNVTFVEQTFREDGRAARQSRLDEFDLRLIEAEVGYDMDGDGVAGFAAAGEPVAVNGALSIAALVGGGWGAFAEGGPIAPILDSRGSMWEPARGQEIVGLRANDVGGVDLMLATTNSRGDVTYATLEIDAQGVAARRAERVDATDVPALETLFNTDFDGDGAVGSVVSEGSVLLAENEASELQVWRQPNDGPHGVVETDQGAGDALTPLVTSRGDAWAPDTGAEVIAVRDEGAGKAVLVRGVDGDQEFVFAPEGGKLVEQGRPMAIDARELALREPAYGKDLNDDGVIGDPVALKLGTTATEIGGQTVAMHFFETAAGNYFYTFGDDTDPGFAPSFPFDGTYDALTGDAAPEAPVDPVDTSTFTESEDVGSTQYDAAILPVGTTTVTGSLDVNGAGEDAVFVSDVYRFTVPTATTVTLQTTNTAFDSGLILLDADFRPIWGDDDGGSGLNALISTSLDAGDYYVAVGDLYLAAYEQTGFADGDKFFDEDGGEAADGLSQAALLATDSVSNSQEEGGGTYTLELTFADTGPEPVTADPAVLRTARDGLFYGRTEGPNSQPLAVRPIAVDDEGNVTEIAVLVGQNSDTGIVRYYEQGHDLLGSNETRGQTLRWELLDDGEVASWLDSVVGEPADPGDPVDPAGREFRFTSTPDGGEAPVIADFDPTIDKLLLNMNVTKDNTPAGQPADIPGDPSPGIDLVIASALAVDVPGTLFASDGNPAAMLDAVGGINSTNFYSAFFFVGDTDGATTDAFLYHYEEANGSGTLSANEMTLVGRFTGFDPTTLTAAATEMFDGALPAPRFDLELDRLTSDSAVARIAVGGTAGADNFTEGTSPNSNALTGAGGVDTFGWNLSPAPANIGDDLITDFTDGEKIALNSPALGFTPGGNPDGFTIDEYAGDTVIRIDGVDGSIVVQNVVGLTPDDFLFAVG